MKQTKRSRYIVIYLIACMLSMYGFMPTAKAASLINVKDTMTTSAMGATATHVIAFDLATIALVNTDKIVITMPAGFNVGAIGAITPPANTTSAGFTGQVLTLNVNAGIAGGTTLTTTIPGIVNHATPASYSVHIETQNAAGTVIKERANAMIAITEQVTMTATVNATLTFAISGVNAGVSVNGVLTTATSTATTTPFGTLAVNASSTVGQQLAVTTNARDGYVVTVQENQELTSNHGATINSFDNSVDGTGSTTAHTWSNPQNTLDAFNTYGHMGLTSDDASISGGDTFGTALFAGLSGTAPLEVMYHTGPSDGTTQDKGLAKVAYSAMIGSLQEAGDYTNTLTYVCTPQY